MRFPVDEALSSMLAGQLGEAGHDAVHLRDRGLQGAEDIQVLQLSQEKDRILISADADFGALLTLGPRRKPSLILLRREFPSAAQEQAALVLMGLPDISASLEAVEIAVISTTRTRIREL